MSNNKVRRIRSGSVSRLLHNNAGHEPYEHKGKTGGFEVKEIVGTSPTLVEVRYRGIERDYQAREARTKGLRNELKRLRMSLIQVCGLHVSWGWDDQGEIDTTYLVASAAPIVPPYEADKAAPEPAEDEVAQEAPRNETEPLGSVLVTSVAGNPVEPVHVPYVIPAVSQTSEVADLFIRPDQIAQATKEIEFEHMNNRDGSAAKMEHRLYHQTLTAIAAGAPEPQRLASLALETQHIYFTR